MRHGVTGLVALIFTVLALPSLQPGGPAGIGRLLSRSWQPLHRRRWYPRPPP